MTCREKKEGDHRNQSWGNQKRVGDRHRKLSYDQVDFERKAQEI